MLVPIPRFADSTRSDSLATRLRAERRRHFLEWVGPNQGVRILDVGGQRRSWRELGLACEVTVLNLAAPDEDGAVAWVRGDALRLPFADQSFDVVFSNSVIEHVGDRAQQSEFAREVRRVGVRYWVQAPNRMFPIEPHFLFPLFQFLPMTLRTLIARYWPFSWDRHFGLSTDAIVESARTIRLPTVREFTEIFPGGVIHREVIGGLTKSMTVASPPF
jgi:SAM-dependent methyltransferase